MTEQVLKERIDSLSKRLPEKIWREFRIDFLGRLHIRASAFAHKDCVACAKMETDIAGWVSMLEEHDTIIHEQTASYFEFIGMSTRHMMSEHRLVTQRQYLVTVLPICLILGILGGLAIGNIGLGAVGGVAAGMVFGIVMDIRAQNKNRVI